MVRLVQNLLIIFEITTMLQAVYWTIIVGKVYPYTACDVFVMTAKTISSCICYEFRRVVNLLNIYSSTML